jgi:hypothetical protein
MIASPVRANTSSTRPRSRHAESFDDRLGALVQAVPLTPQQLVRAYRHAHSTPIYTNNKSLWTVLLKAEKRGAIRLIEPEDDFKIGPAHSRQAAPSRAPPSPHTPRTPVQARASAAATTRAPSCEVLWPCGTVSHEQESIVAGRIEQHRASGDYSKPDDTVLTQAIAGRKGKRLMSLDQARHLQSKSLEQRTRDDRPRLRKLLPDLVAAHLAGSTYLEIAQQFDLSPAQVTVSVKKAVQKLQRRAASTPVTSHPTRRPITPTPPCPLPAALSARPLRSLEDTTTVEVKPSQARPIIRRVVCSIVALRRSVARLWARLRAQLRPRPVVRTDDETRPLLGVSTLPAEHNPQPLPAPTVAETVAARWQRVGAAAVSAARDRVATAQALQADQAANRNEKLVRGYSRGFEVQVEAFFNRHGVAFRTEQQLAEEQVREGGRAVCTPDLLFADPVTINGSPVFWVDAKCYYLPGGCSYLRRSLDAQVKRCNDHYGPGAIIFKHGCSAVVASPGAIMLSMYSVKSATVCNRGGDSTSPPAVRRQLRFPPQPAT